MNAQLIYHCREQFDERMTARRADPKPPSPLSVWYHVACIGNWREVFAEQTAMLAEVGLLPLTTACVLGTPEEAAFVANVCRVTERRDSLREFETPTLQKLWRWCRENKDGATLYIHTKGVSDPNCRNKAAWRQLMMNYVVGQWESNLKKLAVADVVGVDWQDSPRYPHFAGNFWMARADWIANLQSPTDYRNQGGPTIAGNAWERMHAEMWLGSRPWHHIENLCCRNENLWTSDRVFWLLEQSPKRPSSRLYNGDLRMTPEILAWLRSVRERFVPVVGSVLEVGSYNVNGSPREVFGDAKSYLGIDNQAGPGVDAICNAHLLFLRNDMIGLPGDVEQFDLIICCEMLEHDSDPLKTAAAMRDRLADNGLLIITTPANGFPEHHYPRDYWRPMRHTYEDLFFAGLEILELVEIAGPTTCGVARKE